MRLSFLTDASDLGNRDRIILAIAADLGNQILPPRLKYNPQEVGWKDVISSGRGKSFVPSDGAEVVGQLTLPARMRTKLDPEDWRSIIASSLVYEWKLGSLREKHFLSRWLIGVIFPLSMLMSAVSFLYSPRNLWVYPSIFVVFNMVALGPVYLITAPYARRMRLLADQLAAQTVDRDSFILVLQKIRALGLEDIIKLEDRHGLRARFTRRPSVSERIENLKNIPLSRSSIRG